MSNSFPKLGLVLVVRRLAVPLPGWLEVATCHCHVCVYRVSELVTGNSESPNASGRALKPCMATPWAEEAWPCAVEHSAIMSMACLTQPSAHDPGIHGCSYRVSLPCPDRYTVGGPPCNLPFAYNGRLYYDCIGAGNGTAGRCKDTAGSWQKCIAMNRRGSSSGRPCILPALLSEKQGLVSIDGSSGSRRRGSSSNGTTDEEDEDLGATVLVTDCVWLPRDPFPYRSQQGQGPKPQAGSSSGQLQPQSQQQQRQVMYVESCYTDEDNLEECVTVSADDSNTTGEVYRLQTVLANSVPPVLRSMRVCYALCLKGTPRPYGAASMEEPRESLLLDP